MMNLAVDQPILNDPFEEPTRYWRSAYHVSHTPRHGILDMA